MSARMRLREWMAATMVAGVLGLLTGCSGFFPPLSSSGGGGSGSGSGDYVYVANAAAQTVAGYTVATSSTGVASLTAVSGSPYSLSFIPTAMAITPNNNFLYVAEAGGIYAYTINSSTGALTIANSAGAVAITSFSITSMDISPDGQWLFALSTDNTTIDEYQINTTTGVLGAQQPAGYNITTGATVTPSMVKVAPNGAYVFAALGMAGEVIFPFTTSTGVFGSTYTAYPTGNSTTSDNAIAIDSGTNFLYIARSGSSSGLAVNSIGSGGTLSAVKGSPFAAGNGPFGVLIDSTGKYVYAANRTDGTISGYSIGTGGVLAALTGSPFTSGSGVTSLARDNSGKYVLAAAPGGSPDLSMYSFDATNLGSLDPATTTSTGNDPVQAIMVVATH